MGFITRIKDKYLIVAKTKYLEEQIDEFKSKLKAFTAARPKLLARIVKSELKANEKISERSKLDQVQIWNS